MSAIGSLSLAPRERHKGFYAASWRMSVGELLNRVAGVALALDQNA